MSRRSVGYRWQAKRATSKDAREGPYLEEGAPLVSPSTPVIQDRPRRRLSLQERRVRRISASFRSDDFERIRAAAPGPMAAWLYRLAIEALSRSGQSGDAA